MGKSFRKYSEVIRKTLIWNGIVPIMSFSILIFFMLFIFVIKLIVNDNISKNKKITSNVTANIEEYSTFMKSVSEEDLFVDVIEERSKPEKAYEILYKFVNERSLKSHFFIFDGNGNLILSDKKDKPQYIEENKSLFMWGIFNRMKDKPEEVISMINNGYTSSYGYGILSLGKAIVDEDEIVGYILFDFKEEDIFNLIRGYNNNDIIITDKYNMVAANNNKYSDQLYRLKIEFRNKSGHLNINDENYYIKINNVENSNIYVYTITNMEFLYNGFLICILFLVLTFLAIFIAMVYWSKKIALKKTESIDEILKGIKKVQEGNLETKLIIKTKDEFEIIADAYNDMIKNLRELIEANKEEVALRMKSEIKELEAQFNPHFLYNTLETIRVMIKLDKEAAIKIIVKLSNLLRYGINNEINKVTLKDDIEYIKNYLEILKLRFQSRLEFNINIEEDTLNIIVPKLIFQPIIENSIKYGFDTVDKIKIDINSKVIDEKLEITIKDNGSGINEERIEYIRRLLNKKHNDTENIGLYNVHKRIKLLYGKDYGLKIESKEGIGTKIKIILPINN